MAITETSPITLEELAPLLEQYRALRLRAFLAARANGGELMGPGKWLREGLSEADLDLRIKGDELACVGLCYSVESRRNESFSFRIPLADLAPLPTEE